MCSSDLRLKQHRAVINRPSLVGALFIKSVAGLNSNDIGRDRHLIDFAILTTLINSEMSFEISDSKVLNSIRTLTGSLRNRRDLLAAIDGAKEGLDRLEIALS